MADLNTVDELRADNRQLGERASALSKDNDLLKREVKKGQKAIERESELEAEVEGLKADLKAANARINGLEAQLKTATENAAVAEAEAARFRRVKELLA